MQQAATRDEKLDLAGMVADLNSLLRLKTTVIGMKMFARVDEMEAIPKIRRPTAVHTTDQIVSMASRLGWTVGITGARKNDVMSVVAQTLSNKDIDDLAAYFSAIEIKVVKIPGE